MQAIRNSDGTLKISGTSSETKPTTNVPINSTFTEINTGREFTYTIVGWTPAGSLVLSFPSGSWKGTWTPAYPGGYSSGDVVKDMVTGSAYTSRSDSNISPLVDVTKWDATIYILNDGTKGGRAAAKLGGGVLTLSLADSTTSYWGIGTVEGPSMYVDLAALGVNVWDVDAMCRVQSIAGTTTTRCQLALLTSAGTAPMIGAGLELSRGSTGSNGDVVAVRHDGFSTAAVDIGGGLVNVSAGNQWGMVSLHGTLCDYFYGQSSGIPAGADWHCTIPQNVRNNFLTGGPLSRLYLAGLQLVADATDADVVVSSVIITSR